MKTLFLTNEFPPHVYGGAGVHVEYLSHELAKLMDVEVRAFGDQDLTEGRLHARGFPVDTKAYACPAPLKSVFGAAQRAVSWNAAGIDADVVHCHTWYSHLGGIFAKLNYGIPLVVTVHSLEPLRPWKREQLGGGYDFSCWVERTALEMADAVICVSAETQTDVQRLFKVDRSKLHIIYNGIDPQQYHPKQGTERMAALGIDAAKPYVLFVGRITRQKGIIHLVNAIQYLTPGTTIVLAAGAPDTPEIAAEMQAAVAAAKHSGHDVRWVENMVDKPTVIELYAHAAVFCCPSIYEPFGIINLEAMACETPVVASAVGGIKEVVVDGDTGFLVPLEQMKESPFEPTQPDRFSRDLAARINQLMGDPELRRRMAKAGRQRAVDKFSWSAIAAQTKSLYESLVTR
jgi:alpha-maltose-1-phosphate synthase